MNIYDRRDLLSFVGARLFAGRVSDHEVDSRLPFPISHSAYWHNEETFRIVAEHVAAGISPGPASQTLDDVAAH